MRDAAGILLACRLNSVRYPQPSRRQGSGEPRCYTVIDHSSSATSMPAWDDYRPTAGLIGHKQSHRASENCKYACGTLDRNLSAITVEDQTQRKLDIAAVLIALFSALASLCFSLLTRHDVRDQQQVQAIELLKARNERIEKWANQVVDAMSDGAFLCMLSKPERDSKRPALMVRLSSLVDQGRFILPNESPGNVGIEKPKAFRGFRHPALNYPVAMYDLVAHGTCPADQKDPMEPKAEKLRQDFIGAVQDLLDPRQFNELLKQSTQRLRGQ